MNLPLGERIDAGGGFVEYENCRALYQDAHERYQLALTHRQPPAALTDLGLQAVRQGFQPLPVANLPRHAFDLRAGHVAAGILDIFDYRAREQKRRLRDDSKLLAVGAQVKGADVAAIYQDAA